MLADDDPDDRELFVEAALGYDTHIQSVANGTKLMENLHLSEILPDFVFIDLNMPEKSGKECLSEIRGHDRLKNIPVIIYSTSSNQRDIDDTFELGANMYLTKPNSFTELKSAVHTVLQLDWSNRTTTHRDQYVYARE
ncbi:MAG: response regulator [Proteobacteria bacterium]|nr:MAG: response regulator [Pseudomonadota bacterium]